MYRIIVIFCIAKRAVIICLSLQRIYRVSPFLLCEYIFVTHLWFRVARKNPQIKVYKLRYKHGPLKVIPCYKAPFVYNFANKNDENENISEDLHIQKNNSQSLGKFPVILKLKKKLDYRNYPRITISPLPSRKNGERWIGPGRRHLGVLGVIRVVLRELSNR